MNDDRAAPVPMAPNPGADTGDESIAAVVLDKLAQALGRGGPAAVRKIVLTYLREAPGQFAQMRVAIEHGDAGALARVAHSLKSSSASIGALQFAAMCREFEASGRGGDLGEAMAAIGAAGVEFERVHAALTRRLATG